MGLDFRKPRDRAIILQNTAGQGGGSTTPPILDDGNTVAWFDMDLAYITKDGSDFVSVWADRTSNGNDLAQAVGTNQPLWTVDGVLFDGVDNFMDSSFVWEQPSTIYVVMEQVTWTANEVLFSNYEVGLIGLQQRSSTPRIRMQTSAGSSDNSLDLAIGTYGVVTIALDGVSSEFIVDENAALSFNAGLNGMDGLTLGSSAIQTTYGNVEFKEAICRNGVDTSADQSIIYNYLKDKYGL